MGELEHPDHPPLSTGTHAFVFPHAGHSLNACREGVRWCVRGQGRRRRVGPEEGSGLPKMKVRGGGAWALTLTPPPPALRPGTQEHTWTGQGDSPWAAGATTRTQFPQLFCCSIQSWHRAHPRTASKTRPGRGSGTNSGLHPWPFFPATPAPPLLIHWAAEQVQKPGAASQPKRKHWLG